MKKDREKHGNPGGRCKWRQEHFDREDINGKLIISLRDINHAMHARYEGRSSQTRILILLRETGTVTQRELTQRLGIQPGSASEVIAKLENAGLIARTESEADRRTADISLTGEGKRQAEEAEAQRVGRHEEMFSVLSGEEKAQLLALLEKINADWAQRFADRRGEPAHDGRGGHHHHEHCNHDCDNCPHPCGRAEKR